MTQDTISLIQKYVPKEEQILVAKTIIETQEAYYDSNEYITEKAAMQKAFTKTGLLQNFWGQIILDMILNNWIMSITFANKVIRKEKDIAKTPDFTFNHYIIPEDILTFELYDTFKEVKGMNLQRPLKLPVEVFVKLSSLKYFQDTREEYEITDHHFTHQPYAIFIAEILHDLKKKPPLFVGNFLHSHFEAIQSCFKDLDRTPRFLTELKENTLSYAESFSPY